MKSQIVKGLGGVALLIVLLFLTFNRHSKSGYFNYHSEIWADKAGYYVYLPAVLKYKLNANNFPDSIDVKTGYGFTLHPKSGKVITKYTYGVALMQLPFFFVANALAKPLGYKSDGFSPIYHSSINFAAIFYLFIGLLYLFKYLKFRFQTKISWLVVLSIFLGTNLYYYALDETGMSHVYSFSLFSLFLYLLQKNKYSLPVFWWKNILFGALIGLIIVIRPTNIIFLSCYFFLDVKTNIKSRIINLLKLNKLIYLLFGVLIIVLPQLFYWSYVNDSFLSYSYGEEGFNWMNPQFLKTWFSPNNGLFLYTPFYFLIIGSILFMLINKNRNGLFILLLYIVISYVFASWHDWSFGCSFGARSFVEYLALFSIPLAKMFSYVSKLSQTKRFSFILLVLILVTFNLKMTYSYDGCFYGKQNWDWNSYKEIVIKPTK